MVKFFKRKNCVKSPEFKSWIREIDKTIEVVTKLVPEIKGYEKELWECIIND